MGIPLYWGFRTRGFLIRPLHYNGPYIIPLTSFREACWSECRNNLGRAPYHVIKNLRNMPA